MAPRDFLKFCTINGANSAWKLYQWLIPKNSCLGQMCNFDLGPRMSHPVSQLWINCKDCFTGLHNERGQERHGNYINGFSERNLIVFKAIWSFWNKNGMASSSLWICSQVFLLILLKKRDQELHENFFSGFLRKNLFLSHFLMFDWMWSKLSQATIGSLKSQDMVKILKQSGHDFSGKCLCGR